MSCDIIRTKNKDRLRPQTVIIHVIISIIWQEGDGGGVEPVGMLMTLEHQISRSPQLDGRWAELTGKG